MPAICKDCKIEYSPFDGKMVILHNKLWKQVSDNKEDCLCDECIEKRLDRKLTFGDLKKDTKPNILDGSDWIICNQLWALKKNLL